MASIFISYRRDDASGHAGRLCDRLSARFGDDRVFMDIQDILPGQNFEHSIDQTIAACDCVLAVIGPRWLASIANHEGSEDYVRRELAAAVASSVTLVPVLVGGARMPVAGQLPPELAPLSQLNALEVRDEHFDDDVARLTTFLASTLGAGPATTLTRAAHRHRALASLAAVLVMAALATLAFWNTRGPAPAVDPPRLDGVWLAQMQKPGQRSYPVRLEFHGGAAGYIGTVRYPTGDGVIQDIQVKGDAFTFKTVHLPQFESEPATIAYQGTFAGTTLHLTSTDPAGVATGVAEPVPQPAPQADSR
jgi:hypothetical protein